MTSSSHQLASPGRRPDLRPVRRRLERLERRFAAGEFSDTNYLTGPILYQYPAMMVPALQGAVLDAVLTAAPNNFLLDPFLGSGTSLVEALSRSCPSFGIDVNPLAVVIAKAKLGPYQLDALQGAIDVVQERITRDRGTVIEVRFPGLWAWYRKDVAIRLSRIRRAIENVDRRTDRRFLWVCLAETARICSNSRLTTVKLHKRPDNQMARSLDVLEIFSTIVERNLKALSDLATELRESNLLLPGGYPSQAAQVVRADVRSGILDHAMPSGGFGVMLTSPPYGDNTSTVPYGQATYLATSWINGDDLAADTGVSSLTNAYETDAHSLGGSRVGALKAVDELCQRSPSFSLATDELKSHKRDRLVRVSCFIRDLDEALGRIRSVLAPGAMQVITLGNRNVGGIEIPLSEIVSELSIDAGATLVKAMVRDLPSRRRAAARNDRAPRMSQEWILVIRAELSPQRPGSGGIVEAA